MKKFNICLTSIFVLLLMTTLAFAHGSTEAYVVIWSALLGVILLPFVLIATNKRTNKFYYIIMMVVCLLGATGGADYGMPTLSIISLCLPYVIYIIFMFKEKSKVKE